MMQEGCIKDIITIQWKRGDKFERINHRINYEVLDLKVNQLN